MGISHRQQTWSLKSYSRAVCTGKADGGVFLLVSPK